jgi:hypothetical protein
VFLHHKFRNTLSPFINLYSEGDSGQLQAMIVCFAQTKVPAMGRPTLQETILRLLLNLFNGSYQVDGSHREERLEKYV